MAKKGLCEIVSIVDSSGSMASIVDDAIGAFNSFLDDQKKHSGEATFSLVLFNHEYTLICGGVNIQDAQPLDSEAYVPRGNTALLDAVGRTIDDVGERLSKMKDEDRPEKVIVGILTDGLENSSTDYTRQQIFDMIKQQRETYNWEFVFLAANQDAVQEGAKIGIQPQFSHTFTPTGAGVRSAAVTYSGVTKNLRDI